MGGSSQDNGDDAPVRSDGMPRWVKVFVIVGIVVGLLVIIVLLFGDGPGAHGPGRHLPGGDTSEVGAAGDHTPPAGIPDRG